MINAPRLKEEFLELVSISSPSKREGTIARRLEAILKAMGGSVEVDGRARRSRAIPATCSRASPGNTPGALPFLLSGHMDTVGPAEKIRPVVEGRRGAHRRPPACWGATTRRGWWRSWRRSGLLREKSIPHGDIEVVLTICEEYGLLGAKHFDNRPAPARRGLVLDVDGVCELITPRPRGQPNGLHRARPARPRRHLPGAGDERDPDRGGGHRGDEAREGRRGDHRESRPDPGRPRHQHRARDADGAR